jgi:hypothetical protein
MSLYKEWHLKHKMPKNPSVEQRVAWHIGHAKHCSCREMPDSIKKLIKDSRRKAT